MTLDQVLARRTSAASCSIPAIRLNSRLRICWEHQHGLGVSTTWAGTILSRERPIVIIADPGRERVGCSTRPNRLIMSSVICDAAQYRFASGPDSDHRTGQCASGRRTHRARRGDSRRRARARRAGTEARRWKRRAAAQPPRGARGGTAARSSPAGSLRRRLPLVDCGQPSAASRLRAGQRDGGRSGGVGGGEAPIARRKTEQRKGMASRVEPLDSSK